MDDPWGQRATGRRLLLLLLLLVPAAALAGCIANPGTELTVRRGDLVQAELLVLGSGGVSFPPGRAIQDCLGEPVNVSVVLACVPEPGAYVVDHQLPATLPEDWPAARALPPGVVAVLVGMGEGEARLVDNVTAFGNHSPDLVEVHPLAATLPRTVPNPTAYGHNWSATPTGDQVRLEPTEADRGTQVEVPRWCNDRFCLFRSEVTGWNETHLQVRHAPDRGALVTVDELDTHLRVVAVNATHVTIDGNHPDAGAPHTVAVRVHEVRGPPEGQRRAPSFQITTLDGNTTSLADHRGTPLVLEFFATWCPSCRENTNHLRSLQRTYGDRVSVLAISIDPWEQEEELRSFAQENKVSWPMAVDRTGEVGRAYGVGALSTEVVVSPEGAIVHVETGVADHDRVSRVVHDLLPPDHHGDEDGVEDHP